MESSSLGALLQPLVYGHDEIIVARGRCSAGSPGDAALDLVDIQRGTGCSSSELVRFRGEPGYHGGARGRHAPIAGAILGCAEFLRGDLVDDLPHVPRAV